MANHTQNDRSHPDETTHRPGKEPMDSQRPPTSRTTRSRTNHGGSSQNPEERNEETNSTTGYVPRSEDAYDPTRSVQDEASSSSEHSRSRGHSRLERHTGGGDRPQSYADLDLRVILIKRA
uniref:Uncharacterized protein n=1 Tax=Cannabis sativa TaxID=3483 RepID=A0A803QHB4_CANSA